MNIDPCGGPDNINDGCGVIFGHLPPGGSLCPLCKKLKDADPADVEKLQVSARILFAPVLNFQPIRWPSSSVWNAGCVEQQSAIHVEPARGKVC